MRAWRPELYREESEMCQCKNEKGQVAKMHEVVHVVGNKEGKIVEWSSQGYPVIRYTEIEETEYYFNGLNGTWLTR